MFPTVGQGVRAFDGRIRQKQCAHLVASQDLADDTTVLSSRHHHRTHATVDRTERRADLGTHAAATLCALLASLEAGLFGKDVDNLSTILAGRTIVNASHVSEQHQQLGVGLHSHQCRERVVVGEGAAEGLVALVGRHGVIFVEQRHDAQGQQLGDHILNVAATLRRSKVRGSDEDLRYGDVKLAEHGLIQGHQPKLASGSAGTVVGDESLRCRNIGGSDHIFL
mmetsp:Transcript_55880/g.97943  ORF Transcript_55880/g.97943 Transcript_55880/m.97943 type:complete len:224 (-) Transcript_55880:158-829(-)